MITEDYVSFEIAKLLKEKGFPLPSTNFRDWLCCMYDENQNIHWGMYDENWYFRITHQMAMKWLREVHKLNIEPFYMFPAIWEINIKYIDKKTDLSEFEDIRDKSYNSYEEAVEAACIYALKNLL